MRSLHGLLVSQKTVKEIITKKWLKSVNRREYALTAWEWMESQADFQSQPFSFTLREGRGVRKHSLLTPGEQNVVVDCNITLRSMVSDHLSWVYPLKMLHSSGTTHFQGFGIHSGKSLGHFIESETITCGCVDLCGIMQDENQASEKRVKTASALSGGVSGPPTLLALATWVWSAGSPEPSKTSDPAMR